MARSIVGSIWDPSQRNELNRMLEELYSNVFLFKDGTKFITSQHLADDSVSSLKLRTGAVGTRHLLDDSISHSKYQDDSISSLKLREGAVGTRQLLDNSISHDKYQNDSISSLKLREGSVGTSQLLNNSVSAGKIQNGVISRVKFDDVFMFNKRVATTENIDQIFIEGNYIINAGNDGTYPNETVRTSVTSLNVERYEGWVHQTISVLQSPDVTYKRWLGTVTGSVSDWVKIVTGTVSTTDIEDGAITPEKLSMNISDIQRKPLKIFMVGNSFALDTCDYLHHMCAEVNADVTIGVTYLQNANLEAHYDNFISENAVYNYHEYTSIDGVASKSISNGLSLQTMLNKHNDWDLITFQQQSTLSDDYSTYQPHLNSLIEGIKSVIQNNPKIGMLQTWANSTTRRPDQLGMYEGIVSAYENAIADEGIGTFIPAGTAIQSARTNTLMNEESDELTRDGYHLSPLGKYVAGLTMFESIFSGYYKREILSDINYTPEGISDYQVYKAKLAAKNAVLSPMKIMEL